jgi:hypothetical protein
MKRAGIEFAPLAHNVLHTFANNNGQVGDAVTFSADATVGRGAAEGYFVGKLENLDGTTATVTIGGYNVFVPYVTSGFPARGRAEVAVDGAGKIKIVATPGTGRVVTVVFVDAASGLACINF